MNNPELYHETINILVKAYQDGTLEHGNCYACAVGNIVAARMGIKYSRRLTTPVWDGTVMPWWSQAVCTDNGMQTITFVAYTGEAKRQIDLTGYSLLQVAKIERAFEFASQAGDHMFNGLMAVVDVLNEIHEAAPETSKERFVKCTL